MSVWFDHELVCDFGDPIGGIARVLCGLVSEGGAPGHLRGVVGML